VLSFGSEEPGDVLFTLSLCSKVCLERQTRIKSSVRQAEADRPEVSTYHAVEFSKTAPLASTA